MRDNHTATLPDHPSYTVREEAVNSVTHGLGLVLSVAGLTLLVIMAALRGDVWQVVSFSIFGATLTLLYSASTLYHSVRNPRAKQVLRIIDHSAIYLLIAGTYTPFMLVSLRGAWGWTLFGVIWGLAFLGIAFKTLFGHRFPKLSTIAYVLMGWLCLIAIREMFARVPLDSLIWLGVGGVLYTGGVIFYQWRKLPYNHAIWHLFVCGGSVGHFFAVFCLLPAAPA